MVKSTFACSNEIRTLEYIGIAGEQARRYRTSKPWCKAGPGGENSIFYKRLDKVRVATAVRRLRIRPHVFGSEKGLFCIAYYKTAHVKCSKRERLEGY